MVHGDVIAIERVFSPFVLEGLFASRWVEGHTTWHRIEVGRSSSRNGMKPHVKQHERFDQHGSKTVANSSLNTTASSAIAVWRKVGPQIDDH